MSVVILGPLDSTGAVRTTASFPETGMEVAVIAPTDLNGKLIVTDGGVTSAIGTTNTALGSIYSALGTISTAVGSVDTHLVQQFADTAQDNVHYFSLVTVDESKMFHRTTPGLMEYSRTPATSVAGMAGNATGAGIVSVTIPAISVEMDLTAVFEFVGSSQPAVTANGCFQQPVRGIFVIEADPTSTYGTWGVPAPPGGANSPYSITYAPPASGYSRIASTLWSSNDGTKGSFLVDATTNWNMMFSDATLHMHVPANYGIKISAFGFSSAYSSWTTSTGTINVNAVLGQGTP